MPPDEELQATESVIDEILNVLEYMLSEGEELSDELQLELAQVLNESAERIIQLRGQQTQNIPIAGVEPPVGADLLWILAGGQEDAFVNYLRTFPDAGLNELLRNPDQLSQVISQLRNTLPQGQGEIKDGIEKAPLNSSNIYGFQYDPKSGRLLVRFQGGSVYGYNGVPPGIFKVFQQGAVPAKTTGKNQYGRWWTGKIPSLGAAFYNLIRQGGYEYQKLQ